MALIILHVFYLMSLARLRPVLVEGITQGHGQNLPKDAVKFVLIIILSYAFDQDSGLNK